MATAKAASSAIATPWSNVSAEADRDRCGGPATNMLDRTVAVKEIFLPGLTGEDADVFIQRFMREARAAARLHHPNVVTIYDVVSWNGRPWIVMELVAGRSLQEILNEDGPLLPPHAAEIGLQVIAGLDTAHAAGILHRDVKPSNVLITGDDQAKLTDFGIAWIEGDSTLTQAGAVIGTPSYIAPEQLTGERATPASDLWSLGATLYAAVEGRPPFERSSAMDTLAAILNEAPPPPRKAGELTPVLMGLLERPRPPRFRAGQAKDQASVHRTAQDDQRRPCGIGPPSLVTATQYGQA
jgi:serine/threonine protein kinase